MLKLFQNPKKRVEKIHREFDTAADRAVVEAKLILSKADETEKLERLAKGLLSKGFQSCATVDRYMTRSTNKISPQSVINKVEAYQTFYPNNKFIFTNQVEEICKKYNLVCGISKMYTGEIPQKNIEEIVSFVARPEDTYRYRYHENIPSFDIKDTHRFLSLAENPINDDRRSYLRDSLANTPLFICAPPSMMNEKGRIKKGIFRFEDPDPVVLHFVRDGFLVVSKWGIEADDPILFNEKMN